VRGDHGVNAEKLAQLYPGEPVVLAEAEVIQKCTGAAVGFAGPVGLIESIDKLIIDHAVAGMAVGVTGANKTDTHLRHVVPGRDFALDGDKIRVTDIRNACEGDTYQGKPLRFKKGIEVGQVFKLGMKYSTKLGATYQDENGKEHPSLMGCYGIGINRILASAIELGHDDNGIIWPINIAPYEVLITPLNPEDPDVAAVADRLYHSLTEQAVEVLLDDRPLRAGVKFKDADLIGLPIRITVGKRGVAEGHVEVKLRREADSNNIGIDQTVDHVLSLIASLKAELQVK
jgi:prolyl-tRNA synthetase